MTSSNGNFFALLVLRAGNSPVTGEFPAQRPVTLSFYVFFDLRLNIWLSKQSWGWWFETPSCSLWRHCNGHYVVIPNVMCKLIQVPSENDELTKTKNKKVVRIFVIYFWCDLLRAIGNVISLLASIICVRWGHGGVIASLVSSAKLPLHWRHNDHDSVSNHQPHGCLLNRLFRRRSKKTSKLRVTGLCVGNSPGPVNSPHKGPVTRKMFPFDDVIMTAAGVKAWMCHYISRIYVAIITYPRPIINDGLDTL